MKAKILLALAAFTVAGCATGYSGPTYQRADNARDIGYADIRLDENRYRVQYRADRGDMELAQDWALRRAAELTLDHRYDWFQITSRNNGFRDEDFRRYDDYLSYRDRNRAPDRDWPRYDSRFDGDAIAVIEVVMGNNPPPRSSNVYEARRVLDATRGRRY